MDRAAGIDSMRTSNYRLHYSSFLWFSCKFLKGNPKKGTTMEPMGISTTKSVLGTGYRYATAETVFWLVSKRASTAHADPPTKTAHPNFNNLRMCKP